MRDFFDKVPIYLILVIVVSIVRAVARAGKGKDGNRPAAGEGETDEQRRVREIQERIRRIAAERRGQRAPLSQPPPLHAPVPERARVAPPPVVAAAREAELERQEELRAQLEDLREKKFLAERQKQEAAAAAQEAAQSETGLRTTARAQLLDDLRDPSSLRRAIVLREVLGTPVGLR